MTESTEQTYVSCEDFALKNSQDSNWKTAKLPSYVYLHGGSRLKIEHQQHEDIAFGLIHKQSIDDSWKPGELSSEEIIDKSFVQDFMLKVGDYLSEHNLELLVNAMQAELATMQKRRREATAAIHHKTETL